MMVAATEMGATEKGLEEEREEEEKGGGGQEGKKELKEEL